MTEVAQTFNAWTSDSKWIERSMDNAVLESAHPDGCLLLMGPPTYDQADGNFLSKTLTLGHPLNFSYNAQVPWSPMKTLGSTNKFALRDSANYQISIGRLLMYGRSIQRASHTTLVQTGFDIQRLQSPPTIGTGTQWLNEDADTSYLPVGIGFICVNKAGQLVTALWFERACRMNYGFSVAAGQPSVVENCSWWVPVVRPLDITNITRASTQALSDMVRQATGVALADAIPNLATR